MNWLETYLNLIIVQYSDSDNATAEITAMLNEYQSLYDFFNEFIPSFDIDLAWGDRLDIIGKIVGMDRLVQSVVPKVYFGFKHQTNTLGFGLAPFANKNDSQYSDLLLNDNQYRFFLKAKISKNIVSSKLSGDNSIQNAINYLFNQNAYIIDNKDMTLSLYINENEYNENIALIKELDLIPLPQGVGLKHIATYSDACFGFAHNKRCVGFGKGSFARRIA